MKSFFGFLFFLVFSTQGTQAATVLGDLSSDGSQNFITDTVLWRDYLRLDVLGDLNYQDAVKATSLGGAYEEYILADFSVALSFLNAIYPSGITCNNGDPKKGELCGTDGWPKGFFGGAALSKNDTFWFEFDRGRAGRIDFIKPEGMIFLTPDWGTVNAADNASDQLRNTCDSVSWLAYRPHVKGDSGNVPEPSIIALISLGLIGFWLVQRRRYL